MSLDLTAVIDLEIANLEKKLSALRSAREALSGSYSGLRKRRRLTAAEKAAISRRMKATWKKRKTTSKVA